MICCLQVYVLKPSHKPTLQSKIFENSIPDSVSAIPNATNATRDLESEFEAGHEGKIWEIVVDNADPIVCIIVKHVHFLCLILKSHFSGNQLCSKNFLCAALFKKNSVRGSDLTRYLFSWLHALPHKPRSENLTCSSVSVFFLIYL